MSTKTNILKALESNKGFTVSGEELANQLNVSRAAIWKVIQQLRNEGYAIDAITNKGYCLSSVSDVLSPEGITPFLNTGIMGENLHVFKTLESTNKTAKQMALDGALPGTVIISEEQTKGRGRMGRSFFSPSNTGIYMSFILKPKFDATKSVLVTTAASVAVCKAIENVAGISCQIKWVNDIYLNGKKICGILTEAVTDFESGNIEYIVLGIGINYSTEQSTFPQGIKEIAGSLLNHSENEKKHNNASHNRISRNLLIAEVINQIMEINENLESREFISEYKSKSMILGQEISIIRGGTNSGDLNDGAFPAAMAVDIDSDGGLVVQYKDGSTETLNSGEISIRIKK